MPTRIRTFVKNMSNQTKAIIFIIGFGVVGASLIALSHASPIATLSLTPAASTISPGGTLSVTISEDSTTNTTHSVDAELAYDQTKLQFTSIDTSTSDFNVVADSHGGNGLARIAIGTNKGALTGVHTVAKVNFTVLSGASGTTPITFTDNSIIVNDADDTNMLSSTIGGTYVVADTTPPTAPTNVVLTDATDQAITIGWTASTDETGVTGYNVFRDGKQVGTATTVSYKDSGLSPSNSYSYTVTAVDAAGNQSPASTPVSFSTKADVAAPSVPTGLTSPAQTATSISLAWTESTDDVAVAGYDIYRDGTQVGTSKTATYTDTGVKPNTSYSYTIDAYDAAKNTSAQSSASSFSTSGDTVAPSAPTGLTATADSSTVSLKWTAATDNVAVASYKIYRGGVQVGTSTTNSYSDSNVASGTYSYAVSAVDSAGNESDKSTAASVTVSACKTSTGDLNCDGVVDIFDLNILMPNWGKTDATVAQGDVNGDKVINIYDLNVVLVNWTATAGTTTPAPKP